MGGRTAFVLGGGGVLGSAEVGMLRALLERRVRPDLIVGSSVGALNGVVLAAHPSLEAVAELTRTWTSLQARDVFSSSVVGQIGNLIRHGTYLHGNGALRRLIADSAGAARIEDLAVPFQCVAACIEDASARWFDSGPVVDAVLASCAVPGLLPPVRVGERHFMDGGLVASVPVGRAVELGADRVFVLHVGRLERSLEPPARPWDVALVAFEIARRHQFADDMARLPAGVEVHVLPAGDLPPSLSVRYRSSSSVGRRIDAAYEASARLLDQIDL
ncbi:MAG TPA: patatin-like phospholipase family protein [Acidimicrobiales bacterium]|nr:patatin-like phospholipase family protein [Acidimicrobiales bacterium]